MQVTDKTTGEIMVMKELLQFSKEAQESFLKEVRAIDFIPTALFFFFMFLQLINQLVSYDNIKHLKCCNYDIMIA